MYDRPDIYQLLDAVKGYLQREVVPALEADRKQYYQMLVAINVLGIVEREMQMSVEHLQTEWSRLNFVQNVSTPLPTEISEARAALAERNRKLCEEIGAGRYDYAPQRSALFEHLLVTTRAQLEVANPKFLQAIAVEGEPKNS
ncbi:MAG: DUF6285 domain-containing protein [Chloroflexota bacterium]